MASKSIIEYRYVCDNFGTVRHSSHVWSKKSKEKVDKAVNEANEHAKGLKNHFLVGEFPYRTQERTVTKWKDTE